MDKQLLSLLLLRARKSEYIPGISPQYLRPTPTIIVKKHSFLPLGLAVLVCCATTVCPANAKLKVLIIDGQNNHKWAETTPYLKAILEQTGAFTVDVSTTPSALPGKAKAGNSAVPPVAPASIVSAEQRANAWAKWRPRFADYDVLVSNYNGEEWPEAVRAALVAYVRDGGGFVSYHAADNSFANWPEYNQMIALGGWGGRKESAGPYLRLRDGAWVKAAEPGPCGNHGPRAEFLVETFAPEHPIMKGLPAKWRHTEDELYNRLRGPAENLSVLGSGFSEITKEQEPLLMAINYGKGRVFHTTLGHYVEALNGLGFQVTFARGTEWAATGKVTLPAPAPGELTDGPKASVRPVKIPATPPSGTP